MKKIFIVILIFIVNLYSSELDWVNEQIDAIKPPRIGVKNSKISKLIMKDLPNWTFITKILKMNKEVWS